jgi:hypothetical protein
MIASELGETLLLAGGYADGQTVPVRAGQPIPRRYHVEVPMKLTVHDYASSEPLTYQEPMGDFDEYVPELGDAGQHLRAECGELLYRLAESWRNGERVI